MHHREASETEAPATVKEQPDSQGGATAAPAASSPATISRECCLNASVTLRRFAQVVASYLEQGEDG